MHLSEMRCVLPTLPLPRPPQGSVDFMIMPVSTTPPLDASKWPLLLKNYDKLNVGLLSLQCARPNKLPTGLCKISAAFHRCGRGITPRFPRASRR